MKSKDNDTRIVFYSGKDDETEIAVKVSLKEAIKWGGFGMCDMCGLIDNELYLCPELGHKALCPKCFKEHKKMVKWYTEDLHFTFDTLIQYVLNYKLKWSESDLDLIDEFFASKGHLSLHIRKFIEENKSLITEEKNSIDEYWEEVLDELMEGLENGKEA